MGNNESTCWIYVCLSELNDYSCKRDEIGVIGELQELIRVSEHQKISKNEVKLIKTQNQHYVVQTHSPINKTVMDYQGCITVINQDGQKVYEGISRKGKRSEFGKQYNANGQVVYEGYYMNDWRQGWGKTKYYQGQFFKGKRHGWGIYHDIEKKVIYQGMFQQDYFQGIGFLNVPENEVKDFMQQNTFINDPSIQIKYVGEWSQGKISGRGKIVTRSEIYSGQFRRGQFEGQGKLIEKNGKVSEGKFYLGVHI